MKWLDVASRARELRPESVRAGLAELSEAPQFVALVALVLQHEEDAAAIAANPRATKEAGVLAHAAGALYQARRVREELQALETREDGRA